jgi:hypothetical protein
MNICNICKIKIESPNTVCSIKCFKKMYGNSIINLPKTTKLEYHRHYNKTYYIKNKATINKKNLLYEKNPKRRKYLKLYEKERKQTDVLFKLRKTTSTHIKQSITNNKNIYSNKIKYPFKIKKLKNHLEKTMPYGYTWNDYLTSRLHIDHKIPLSWFKNKTDFFNIGWNINNLRLLPAKENFKKRAKWAVVEEEIYFNYDESLKEFKKIYNIPLDK